jgi:general secretion pathway protein A
MYLQHFGFQHPPFAINPDPRFLYLSPKHQEALAHLLYGLGEGGGFVMLSGEVGTGKTTLCYTLLENLGEKVDVALILNPRLSSLELLAALCDELHVPYPAATDSRKTLLDALNQFLLANHARGRRTVAVIDEAQNLSGDVMEQIRLLTNLETPTTKLLQIVLVGQPELPELLAEPQLRQVDQRITARYHLASLSRSETTEYIRHRLSVAGGPRHLFSRAAIRTVFAASRGIPRLINVICDRALLGAYTLDRPWVNRQIVAKACREVLGPDRAPSPWVAAPAAVAFVTLAAATLLAVMPEVGGQQPSTSPTAAGLPPAQSHDPPASVAPPVAESRPVASEAPKPTGPGQPRFIAWASEPANSEPAGLVRLLRYWRPDIPVPAVVNCDRIKAFGLRCLRQQGVWDELRRQNLPALIMVRDTGGNERSVLMKTAGPTETTFLGHDGSKVVYPNEEILPHWTGSSLMLWAPPANRVVLWPGMSDPAVLWLRERLALAGYHGDPDGPDRVFDADLKARVMQFQEQRGLPVDGIVGEKTLVALNGVRPPDGESAVSLNH